MKYIPVCLFAFLFFLTACETTLDVDLPEPEARLAAHCFVLNTDLELSASVSNNVGLLDPGDPEVLNDATVNIYEEGELMYTFLSGDPVAIDRPFQTGKTYEMRVNHPTLGEVSARQTMPGPVLVKKAKFDPDGGINQFGDEGSQLTVTFVDPVGEANFYELTVLMVNREFPTRTQRLYPMEENLFATTTWNDYLIFDDRTFDGQEHTTVFQFYEEYSESENRDYFLIWRTITEERYLYLSSVTAQLWNEDNPFAEPVPVFSNMEGGLGIFGLGWEELLPVEVE